MTVTGTSDGAQYTLHSMHRSVALRMGKVSGKCYKENQNTLFIYLFSRLFDVSTSSSAHLTIIFFLHLSLSFQSSSINPFSPNSPLIPSAQVALGLPRFLLPGGLPSSIL